MVSPVRGFHKASIHTIGRLIRSVSMHLQREKNSIKGVQTIDRGEGRSRRARRTAAESIGCSFRSSWSEMGEQRWKINGGRKCYDRLEKGDAILTRRFLIEEPVEDTFGSLTFLSKSLNDLTYSKETPFFFFYQILNEFTIERTKMTKIRYNFTDKLTSSRFPRMRRNAFKG